ncbi:MAG: 2,3-epoxybenzoyl-CoA dihydrolase [Sedimenticola thiotaurini]|uniref:2,3-epoxybenzoyl-CoA dihydrolase n=1 Tax=Sedimenticola thiotaurini TaxID=1543721 RepID=A0A558CL01_9GAMM|nr:MAG: 2,3-epoxybenzoyl-CoA dihydrolase [Sedimenticola thiotaurini]
MISFQTNPAAYQHWELAFEGPVARLRMGVKEDGGLVPGYELKLNSYDLGVDIELYDAVQRLRFEHPEVKTVILESAKERVFCAGANIRMLGSSTHVHKVNFCKFTNETRNSIEDASEFSGQRYLCAINGTAAGGGYELALAADHIMLIDDGNASVSLPEVPLLAVLPGTGGLTRLVDKRMMRRDLADVFCSIEEGIKGQRAVDWRLVDETVVSSQFPEAVKARAEAMASGSDRPSDESGISLEPLGIISSDDERHYAHVDISVDRAGRTAVVLLKGPSTQLPADLATAKQQGCNFWPLALVRELDDALLYLRTNEPEIGTVIFKTAGDSAQVAAYENFLSDHQGDWFIREIILYMKRTLKRVDYTSRSTFAFVEPGSCFYGFLAELLFAVDRSYMLDGQFEDDDTAAPTITLSAFNFGVLPMGNGLTRLQTRFLGESETLEKARSVIGESLLADAAEQAGLVTFALDDIDWEDDIRFLLEERASYSPDALTGMEANLRFAGPETMETKIFGRLSAWQNWIFQRPNAVGEQGALKCFGTGERATYDQKRV